MGVIRTIAVDVNNLEFPANWEEGETVNQKEFTVTIDGKPSGGGFRYDISENDWFDVILTDNTFTVTVKQNFNINDRNGYITIHHNCIQGDDGEKIVYINQNGIECLVQTSISSIAFQSVNTATDVKEIDVTVSGGNKKYFIKSFKEYNSDDKVIKNDNGIKVEKINNEKLKITSYGRVFLENGQYYEIVLAHDNDVSKISTIIVRYDDVTVKNDVPTLTRNRLISDDTHRKTSKSMIPTFTERLQSEMSSDDTPSLTIYGLNVPVQTKKRGRKSKLSDEIVFESTGGSFEYDMDVKPSKSLVSVKITSDFVFYKISYNVLTLTAKCNPYVMDRKCLIKINNINDPFNVIVKTIVQKGVDQK
jgi:hypothetical protein